MDDALKQIVYTVMWIKSSFVKLDLYFRIHSIVLEDGHCKLIFWIFSNYIHIIKWFDCKTIEIDQPSLSFQCISVHLEIMEQELVS